MGYEAVSMGGLRDVEPLEMPSCVPHIEVCFLSSCCESRRVS